MYFPDLKPQHLLAMRVGVALLSMVVIGLIIYRQLKANAAYANAMNAIAEAARKGENVHLQIAHFASSDHVPAAKPK